MLWPCVVVGSVLCTIPLGASLDINVNDIGEDDPFNNSHGTTD